MDRSHSASQPKAAGLYQPGAHCPQLDGLRGLAILLVTLYRFGKDMPVDTLTGSVLGIVLRAGQHGVELFFVLSGFLITGILLDSRGSPNQLRNFFIRRSLRILPLYMVTLALMTIAVSLLKHAGGGQWLVAQFSAAYDQQIYLWLYLTNVQMSLTDSWCFGPLDHFWSLAVEEHFYLVWPVVVAFCLPRSVLRVAIVGAITAIGMRTMWLGAGGTATIAEVLTVMRCDGLLLGAAVAVLVRLEPNVARYHRLAIASSVSCLLIGIVLISLQRRVWMAGSISWTIGWTSLLICMITSSTQSPVARALNGRWLRSLGQLSYAMYVFQSPLIPCAAWVLMLLGMPAATEYSVGPKLLYVAAMFALTVACAWLSWHLFEKHWLRLKDIFPQTKRSVQPTPIGSEGAFPGAATRDSWAVTGFSNIVSLGSQDGGKAPLRG